MPFEVSTREESVSVSEYFAVGHETLPLTASLEVESHVVPSALIHGPSADAPGAFGFPALHDHSLPTPAPDVDTLVSPIGSLVGSTDDGVSWRGRYEASL